MSASPPAASPHRRSCFVVQGFGKKTDYTAGRVLDLDASYAVIREAVLDAGLDCRRCDEVIHAGVIDAPMYEQLMRADLVIADLSTYNINAAFELGVRYGLRPYATIIVAEEGFNQPFDVSHSVIRRYRHLGEDLGTREAARFRRELAEAIREIVDRRQPDSPVYTYLSRLVPPSERVEQALDAAARAIDAATAAAAPDGAEVAPATAAAAVAGTTKLLREQALALINPPPGRESDFAGARELLRLVLAQGAAVNPGNPADPCVVQQLALATYKARQPTPLQALLDAREVLRPLQPATTNDPETLGLWGAIHKRLWDLRGDPDAPADAGEALSEAIAAHTRGFYLKQDYYNGVNLACLLETRALEHARRSDRDDAVADRVLARRTREELLRHVALRVAELAELAQGHHDAERYWLAASLWETAAGLGRDGEAARHERAARSLEPPDWMLESTEVQVTRLLAQQAELSALLAALAARDAIRGVVAPLDDAPAAPARARAAAGSGAAAMPWRRSLATPARRIPCRLAQAARHGDAGACRLPPLHSQALP